MTYCAHYTDVHAQPRNASSSSSTIASGCYIYHEFRLAELCAFRQWGKISGVAVHRRRRNVARNGYHHLPSATDGIVCHTGRLHSANADDELIPLIIITLFIFYATITVLTTENIILSIPPGRAIGIAVGRPLSAISLSALQARLIRKFGPPFERERLCELLIFDIDFDRRTDAVFPAVTMTGE